MQTPKDIRGSAAGPSSVKVALFTAFPPDLGGGAAGLRSIVSELDDLDLEWFYLAKEQAGPGTDHWLGPPIGLASFLIDLFERAARQPVTRKAILRLARAMEADVYWVVAHDEGLLVAAELIAAGKRVHLSVQDDPGAVFARSRKYRPFQPLLKRVFPMVLRGSASVDVISSAMQETYRRKYGVESSVLYRYAGTLPEVSTPPKDGTIRVGHIGHLYDPSPFRAFVDACLHRQQQGQIVRIVTIGRSPFLPAIAAERPEMFEDHGQMDEHDAVQVLATCHFTYAMYPWRRRLRLFRQTSVPMKLSTYILAQRPVFAHAPQDSTLARIVEHYRIGQVCDTPDAESALQTMEAMLAAPPDKLDFEAVRAELMGFSHVAELRRALGA